MHIGYGSDWHLEFEPNWLDMLYINPDGHPHVGPDLTSLRGAVDVMVLAGDIAVGPAAGEYACQVSRFLEVPVIHITGNHEFYDQNIDRVTDKLRENAASTDLPVHFLNNDVVEIEGVRFAGAPLWTDLAIDGQFDLNLVRATDEMNDYAMIRRGDLPLRPADTLALHQESRAWLSDLFANKGGADVVVTHHAPSGQSVPPNSRRWDRQAFYASNLDNDILAWSPSAWIHGHTHEDQDYQIGETRIIASQRGYVFFREDAKDYSPGIITL